MSLFGRLVSNDPDDFDSTHTSLQYPFESGRIISSPSPSILRNGRRDDDTLLLFFGTKRRAALVNMRSNCDNSCSCIVLQTGYAPNCHSCLALHLSSSNTSRLPPLVAFARLINRSSYPSSSGYRVTYLSMGSLGSGGLAYTLVSSAF